MVFETCYEEEKETGKAELSRVEQERAADEKI